MPKRRPWAGNCLIDYLGSQRNGNGSFTISHTGYTLPDATAENVLNVLIVK